MHTTNIEPLIRDRYRALKGREFAFADVDPSRVAHLIIDMRRRMSTRSVRAPQDISSIPNSTCTTSRPS